MPNVGTALPLYIAIQAFLGQPDFTHQSIIEYVAQSTQTGSVLNSTTVTIPAGSGLSVNLSQVFPAISNCQFIVIQDITATGQPFSVGFSAGALVAVAASSPFCWVANGGVPPTLYLTNPNGAAGNVQISVVSL